MFIFICQCDSYNLFALFFMTLPKTASDGSKSGSNGCFYCFSDCRKACFSLSMASIDPTKLRIYFGLSSLPVSVSAMQPCSASFNSLPLPREYNITNMTAAKRYESVWNAFLNELPHNPTTTLTSFLKRCNVRQGRMKRWMENNGLSVKEAKKRLRDCQHDGIGDPMSPLSEDSGSLFLPMATDKPAPRSESCDILSGVSLTFPDGTQVNIKRGSAQAVMSFLKLYQREDLPCLD